MAKKQHQIGVEHASLVLSGCSPFSHAHMPCLYCGMPNGISITLSKIRSSTRFAAAGGWDRVRVMVRDGIEAHTHSVSKIIVLVEAKATTF